jgi:isoleucyl-tRNA synthetase
LPIWRTEDKQEVLIGSVEEVIQRNRKVNSGRIPKKRNPFKFEIGNMDEENYDLIDLHKM